jgi:acyl-coenzyme A thioesterase PaaI-like protein
MNILEIPFNKLIEISASENDTFLVQLKNDTKYTNHLGTVHAAAQFALAEAAGGEFLVRAFPDLVHSIIPVVRGVEAKFKKPATGQLSAKAQFVETDAPTIRETLLSKKRVSLKLQVELYDQNNQVVFTAVFDWFVVTR